MTTMRVFVGVLVAFLAVNVAQVRAGNDCDVTEEPWGNAVDQGHYSIKEI